MEPTVSFPQLPRGKVTCYQAAGSHALKRSSMYLHLSIGPVVALIAGILILVAPRLLNYIVAIYLIIIGVVGLFGTGNLHLH
jgi:threonine/homoserine efflux transporter RhtA